MVFKVFVTHVFSKRGIIAPFGLFSDRYWSGLFLFLVIFMTASKGFSQNPIDTAFPMLKVAPDAVASGLGDIGVATAPDTYSQYWNASKYVFAPRNTAMGLSYVPYMLSGRIDVNLLQIGGYHKINNKSALGFGFRYFALGNIDKSTDLIPDRATLRPNELAFDASYSMKLDPRFSVSFTARFVSSALRTSQNSRLGAINSFSFDLGGYYQSKTKINGLWRAGWSISNIGAKIQKEAFGKEVFLPTTLRLGATREVYFTGNHKISVGIELGKLLVPTPPKYDHKDTDGDGITESVIVSGKEDNVNFFDGMIRSFYDAPGGFAEELSEITLGTGAEYSYLDTVAFRLGHFYEDPTKGYRKYITIGAGFKHRRGSIDLSYLFSTSNIVNPMGNSLKLSLTLDLVKAKNMGSL